MVDGHQLIPCWGLSLDQWKLQVSLLSHKSVPQSYPCFSTLCSRGLIKCLWAQHQAQHLTPVTLTSKMAVAHVRQDPAGGGPLNTPPTVTRLARLQGMLWPQFSSSHTLKHLQMMPVYFSLTSVEHLSLSASLTVFLRRVRSKGFTRVYTSLIHKNTKDFWSSEDPCVVTSVL